MGEPISVSVPVSSTGKTISFETGLLAQQSQGAVVGRIGDTIVLATANAASDRARGHRFFPAYRRRRRTHVRGRENSRVIFPPGRSPHGERHPHSTC